MRCLAAETVESAALSLQSIYNVHGDNGLALGVFGVGDGITDDVLKEDLQDATSFLIDETGDMLDTSTAMAGFVIPRMLSQRTLQ